MAVGDVTTYKNSKRVVCLMTGQTANTGQPADGDTTGGGSHPIGVPTMAVNPVTDLTDKGCFYYGEDPEVSTLVISSTAGSGTMVGTFTLWGYCSLTAKWYPIPVNGGVALAELSSPGNTIRHREDFTNLGRFDYLYLQLASVGGTDTAFEAYLITARGGRGSK